ncbi:MAG: lamin tail domain-containing protein [Flavobacteriia bacterium]
MKLILFPLLFMTALVHGQLKLNEISNANSSFFIQNSESYPDWLELYNGGLSPLNLDGYALTDDKDEPFKWQFPAYNIPNNGFLTVLATGEGEASSIHHYETVVYPSNSWQYFVPTGPINQGWNDVSFSSTVWASGQLGIGYGDGDDVTLVPAPSVSVYVRHFFNVTNKDAIRSAILDIDYDDGFVAYLNGEEIARSGLLGTPPAWNELASDHEATVYQGGQLTSIEIDTTVLFGALTNGVNCLAIEVHNNSTTSSDLSLIPYFTFGIDQPTIYFGGLVHPGFDQENPSLFFETNFSIASAGETIYLTDPTGVLVDSLVVPDLEPGMSIGKFNDGSANHRLFLEPTPGSSNNLADNYSDFEATPVIQTGGAFLTAPTPISVANLSTNSGLLRYTLNGQNPDEFSTLYNGPITINATSVLKVRCFPTVTGILPSAVATATFIYNEEFTIPVISITTDDENLYGPTGIFDNYTTDWKRPCVIEYFDADGIKKFQSRASIKPDGGAGGSRSNPQHSVTIEPANNLFGEGKPVIYPLIPEKNFINEFYAFYLRNGSNYWNQYPQKDATLMRMMRETNVNSQAYTPVVAFLNGEYFGVYELREKANEGYYENNYGNDRDSLDLLSVSYFYGPSQLRVVKGSDSSFYSMVDFVTTEDPNGFSYFNDCHQKIDLFNFTDYIAAENWFANFDWIYNNMKINRCRTYDNKWRFQLQDMELGLGGWSDFNSNIFDYFRYNNQPNNYWAIYNSLIQNGQFKKYFINRYADLMNTAMRSDQYEPIVTEMYEQLLPELPRHFQRWTGDVSGGMLTYTAIYNGLLNQFENRSDVVRNQMINEFGLNETVDVTLNVQPAGAGLIKISTIVPENLPWTGVYFDGNPVGMTAIANPGYTFVGWVPNGQIPFNELEDVSIQLNIPNDGAYTALFEGIPEPATVTVSEINYNADSSVNAGNWIELHNYGTKDLALTNWSVRSKDHWDRYTFADGTVLPANGHLVICENEDIFQSVHPDITNYVGSTGFGWNNSQDSVQLYNAVGELVLMSVYKDSRPYPVCADGWGRTLENSHPETSVLDSLTWFCGCIGGSPGQAYEPCQEPIAITEINYNNIGSDYNAGDWVEIRNMTGSAISLNNYVFKDSKNDHTAPLGNLILDPGGIWVLGNNGQLFAVRHDGIANYSEVFDFGLNGSEALRLYNDQGRLISSVNYDNSEPWPIQPSIEDYTLEYDYYNGFVDPSSADSWFVGCEGGSPGKIFTPCPVVPEGEFGFLYPNPTYSQLTVAFDNSTNSSGKTDIEIYDIAGNIVHKVSVQAIESKVGEEINVEFLRGGVYYVKIIQDGRTDQIPFVKL